MPTLSRAGRRHSAAGRRGGGALRVLDHPPPRVAIEALLARARRGSPRRIRHAGAIAAGLALCAAAAAAALPRSPVHRAIARALLAARTRPAEDRASNGETRPAARSAGIAVVPGSALEVRLGAWQTKGTMRVVFSDSTQASLVATGGDAAFAVAEGRIDVDSHGTSPSFTLTVPRRVHDVRVQVDTTVLFRKHAAEITAAAQADQDGGYTFGLAPRTLARPPR